MGAGYYLPTRLEYGATQADLTLAMVVIGLGLGLGAVMQTYTLIVQNATSREDLGVATSTTQLSRSMGATLGTAIFGTIMTSGMKTEIPKHLPEEALNGPQAEQFSGGAGGVGAVLDPNTLGQLPDPVVTGIREGLAAAMHPVFLAGLPIIGVALVASILIKELPLRTTAFADADAGKVVLQGENQSAPEGVHAQVNAPVGRDLILAGLTLEYLAQRIESGANGESSSLISAASEMVPANGMSDRERALVAVREIVRPLARHMLYAGAVQSGEANGTPENVADNGRRKG